MWMLDPQCWSFFHHLLKNNIKEIHQKFTELKWCHFWLAIKLGNCSFISINTYFIISIWCLLKFSFWLLTWSSSIQDFYASNVEFNMYLPSSQSNPRVRSCPLPMHICPKIWKIKSCNKIIKKGLLIRIVPLKTQQLPCMPCRTKTVSVNF